MGPSTLDEKIRNDSFRTMTTDASYLENVTEDELIRLLNAFVWITKDSGKYNLHTTGFSHLTNVSILHKKALILLLFEST
jgi:cell cycle arrest protein BUB2